MRGLVVFLANMLFAQCLVAGSFPDIVDQVRRSVVGVGTAYPQRQPNRKNDPVTFLATGFVVGNGLQIVSNAHVIPKTLDADNNQTLAVFSGRGENAKARPARVVATDLDHDLVLLEISGKALPALSLGDSNAVREGQEVALTGFPIGVVLGLYPVTHRGIVSAIVPMARPVETSRALTAAQLRRMRSPINAFQLDAVAFPGNSGSPVYQPSTGHVIGVINSVFVKETRESILAKPSGISYAIPAVHIHTLLELQ